MRTYNKLKYVVMLIIMLIFTGCKKEVECPGPYTIYGTTIVEVPTKVKRPHIECSLDTEDDMYDCIVLQKKIIEELTEQ